MKKILITIGILILLIISVLTFRTSSAAKQSAVSIQQSTVSHAQHNTFSYKGQDGKDALTLLKAQTSVEQDQSGMVVGINGTKSVGHEYWAFYVNGKLASVGPADYKTKNGETIEWKIEKY